MVTPNSVLHESSHNSKSYHSLPITQKYPSIYCTIYALVKAEKRFTDEELRWTKRCAFVYACADRRICIHKSTEQRRRPNQSTTMVLAHSTKKITKYILLQLPHLDANFSLQGNYRLLVEK
jgi:hypothetical protein